MSGVVSSELKFKGSGTSGSPITLLFETNAKLSAPFWPPGVDDRGAIHNNANSFLVIDGGTNGRIEATANGSILANQTGCVGICINGGHDVTIQNLIIDDLYVLTSPTDPNREGQAIVVLGSTGNITVNNCTLTDGDTMISFVLGENSSNWVISNCTIGRCNHGINAGITQNNIIVNNFQIFKNRIDDLDVWDTPTIPFNPHHLDGIIIFCESPAAVAQDYANAGHINNLKIYQNNIGPHIGFGNSGAMFLPDQGHMAFTGIMVYNNLFTADAGKGWTNGFIVAGSQGGLVANNTMVSLGSGGDGLGLGGANFITYKNNLHLRVGTVIYAPAGGMTASEHNVYGPVAGLTWVYTNNAFYSSFSQWQSVTGLDGTSVVANPLLDGNYVPTAVDTVARDKGENLSAFFTTDLNGNVRTGAWDIGAFEFGGSAADQFPAFVSATIPSGGNTISIVFSENVTVNSFSGFSLAMSGGATTLSGGTVVNPTTISFTLNRNVGSVETGTISYTTVANGIEDSIGQDLQSFTALPVVNNSTVAQAAAPTFSPVPGAYTSTQNVVMSSTTSGSTVRYTTDGTDPTASSTLYTSPVSTSVNTTYKAKAFATGFMSSPISTGVYQIGDFVLTSIWTSSAVATQTGTFTWSFQATSSVAVNDAVIALADHTAAAYSDLAVIARFNLNGLIDAWNGIATGYTAVNPFPYVAGQAYNFVVTVNIPSHTYSMTVVSASGGTPVVIATNYGFRGASVSAVDLDVFAGVSDFGTVTVRNMTFNSAATVSGIQTLNVTNLRIGGAPTQSKRIIHWGTGTSPQVANVVTNKTYIDTLPFDGIVVRFPSYQDVVKPGYVANYTALYAEIGPMKDLLTKVKYNYIDMLTGNQGLVDPFDDWTQTIANFVTIAKVCRDAGLQGIFLDTEEYNVHWWQYPTDVVYAGSKTAAEYQEQWRLRGAQTMQAIIAEWPQGQIVFPVGPWRSVSATPAGAPFGGSPNWLGGYFFMGMWAVSPGKVIDGGELYYNRTATNFSDWRTFARVTLTQSPQSPPLIQPSSLYSSWTNTSKMSFGIFTEDTSGTPAMSSSVLQTTIVNAMPSADEFVWTYGGTPDFLAPAGGSVGAWQNAVSAARTTLGLPPP
jgi:hypothetical protein